jgi:hypothetical protein
LALCQVLTLFVFIVRLIYQNDKLNTRRIILSSIAALSLFVAMVSATALSHSANAFSWPCIDRSEGKAPMAISGNNLYTAWWGNGTKNFDVMFKASNDNGQTFGKKINLSNSPNGTSADAGIGASGDNVYVAYWDNKTGIGKVYLRASTDKGQTFRPEITLTDPADYPKLSAQTKAQFEKLSPYEMKLAAGGNNVYVVASGAESINKLTSPPDIFIKSSNDNGKTFGKEINLSNSTGVKSTRAEVEASGDNVYVTWWDKIGIKDQPMMRISHDGGKTFGEASILTANSTSTA